MDIVEISSAQIDVAAYLSQMTDSSSGGTACFFGTTRDTFQEKKVLHLEYEAYKSMAQRELLCLCQSMRKKWVLKNIILIHRIGIVPVADISVFVAASAVHREAALEAVSFGIDAIKAKVPIWKKEQYSDGSYCWKSNFQC